MNRKRDGGSRPFLTFGRSAEKEKTYGANNEGKKHQDLYGESEKFYVVLVLARPLVQGLQKKGGEDGETHWQGHQFIKGWVGLGIKNADGPPHGPPEP